VRLSMNPESDFSAATASVTGTGWDAVYIFVADNNSSNSRTAEIYAGKSPSDVVTTITQSGK